MSTREHIKFIINKYTNSEYKVITGIELANKLGVSIGSINRWKQGICIPDVDLFKDICVIFGISINEFLGIDNSDVISLEDNNYIKKDISEYEDGFTFYYSFNTPGTNLFFRKFFFELTECVR